jgi:hypothetical protein
MQIRRSQLLLIVVAVASWLGAVFELGAAAQPRIDEDFEIVASEP